MTFILNEPTTFIDIKLTDAGRRMACSGDLKFSKAIFSDREIDYSVDRTGKYKIINNRILSPSDFYPGPTSSNLDGMTAFILNGNQVTSNAQIITGTTESTGFFSGVKNTWTLTTSMAKGLNTISYSNVVNAATLTSNSNRLQLASSSGATYFPVVGDLMFVPWIADDSVSNFMSNGIVDSSLPVNGLWYRIISASTPNIYLDRNAPPFLDYNSSTTCFFYPWNGIETYYGTGATQETSVWNLNIVRTNTIAGTNVGLGVSGYTNYGSIQYNGTAKYFGFSAETPSVGFVHYSNKFSGNTYAEQLMEGTVQMHLPILMWHNVEDGINGKTNNWGSSFFDSWGQTYYDAIAKTTYRNLIDRQEQNGIVIGRVYHKLKLIVITDQELLNAISYKSNRCYTLPDFQVSLTSEPKQPYTSAMSATTGYVKEDYDYFVTYIIEGMGDTSNTNLGIFGHPNSLHCGYIKKIKGSLDENGMPQYIDLRFTKPDSFPFLREKNDIPTMQGWSGLWAQVLVSEQPSFYNYDVASVPYNSWIRVSNRTLGGNGIYRSYEDYGDGSIVAGKLNNYNFIISQEDVTSGSTYMIESGLTMNQNYLNFGDESFFFGNIQTDILATSYKSCISVTATLSQGNTSINPTYDPSLDNDVYITEVMILDNSNQVVAVGKPTYPIKKVSGKYLTVQLDLDF